MSYNFTIALDVMGGDVGPEVVIPAADQARQTLKNTRFLLVGDEGRILPLLSRYPALAKVSEIRHTDRAVSGEEKPSVALRTGRQSSMRLAIDAVADGHAACIVSAGNTGALMVMAKMVLKCLPGIQRPAIASIMPSIRGETVVLDLGANIQCDAEILSQFAVLGAVYARAVKGNPSPTVGLLNIGSEEMKGHDHLREAAAILSDVRFPGRFHGFVEGNDISMGTVDVVVTDGFTGNVALKVTEGVGKMAGQFLREVFTSSWLARLGYLLAWRGMTRLRRRLDPRVYNGGMFLGLDGVCVKSHGGADALGFSHAILMAAELVEHGFNDRVAEEISRLMSQESFVSHGTSAAAS